MPFPSVIAAPHDAVPSTNRMPEFNANDIQIWIAICGVHTAESLLVGRNFASGIWKH